MRILVAVAAATLALFAAGCANRTGQQSIAEYCTETSHQQYDMCKQHRDTEEVRTSLGQRIQEVFGAANHAQQTADAAMARNITCVTRTLRRTQTGSCDTGYTLTGCTQTHYTHRAGGVAILRQIDDTQCRFNARVLEVQVRCCAMGPNPPPATMVSEQPAPQTPPPPPPTS